MTSVCYHSQRKEKKLLEANDVFNTLFLLNSRKMAYSLGQRGGGVLTIYVSQNIKSNNSTRGSRFCTRCHHREVMKIATKTAALAF